MGSSEAYTKGLPQDVVESIQAMFSDEKEDFFESVDFFESIEAIPVFAGTSFERERANSPNVITLASGTIHGGSRATVAVPGVTPTY